MSAFRKPYPFLFLLCWLFPFFRSGGDFISPLNPRENIQIVLGPAEVVRGPDPLFDNPFNAFEQKGGLTGYIGNGDTAGYSGGSLETLKEQPMPVITKGSSFDSCGAWLNSVWQDGLVIHGWYHAETNCAYPSTDKSVAYAESWDGGKTFFKPGYPNNQVITAPTRYTGDQNDEGDQRVLRVGNYLYMYFLASRDWQVHLARSNIVDGGKPGTWYKYFQGAFSQSGIGGESSALDLPGHLSRTWISYSSYLGAFIGFSYQQRNTSQLPGQYAGLGFSLSPDGISHWTTLPYLILPSEGEYWGRDENSLELTEYPSLIGLYGDNQEISRTFWLYYMAINAGEGFDQRYLVRRKVSFEKTYLTSTVDLVPRVALSQYIETDDTWFTTRHITSGYQYASTIGYLFTDPVQNTVPVYDCYIPAWHDHMLVSGDASCGGGKVEYVGRVGWISTVPFASSQAVYRCYDVAKTNHFVSPDSSCDGKTVEYQMGYVAREEIPADTFVALSRYENEMEEDTWVTTAATPTQFAFRSRLGYLLASEQPGTLAVYDCYLPNERDHMLDILPGCGGGANQNLGRMGWIRTEPFPGSMPVYRCVDPVVDNHFVSTDPLCEGKSTEWGIGYLASSPAPIVDDIPLSP